VVGDHTEQEQFTGDPAKFQPAPIRQLCHIDAVSGHTADPFVRVGAGQIFFPLAGLAQRATIVAGAETCASGGLHFFHQPQDSSIVGLFGMLDGCFILKTFNIPDGGDHQGFLLG
jgi:hypothetical protein